VGRRAGHYRNDSQWHGVFRCSYRSGGLSFCGPWSVYAQNERARSTLSVSLTQQFGDKSGRFRRVQLLEQVAGGHRGVGPGHLSGPLSCP